MRAIQQATEPVIEARVSFSKRKRASYTNSCFNTMCPCHVTQMQAAQIYTHEIVMSQLLAQWCSTVAGIPARHISRCSQAPCIIASTALSVPPILLPWTWTLAPEIEPSLGVVNLGRPQTWNPLNGKVWCTMRRGSGLFSHAHMINTGANRELSAVFLQPQKPCPWACEIHLTFIWMVANSAEARAVNAAHSRGPVQPINAASFQWPCPNLAQRTIQLEVCYHPRCLKWW